LMECSCGTISGLIQRIQVNECRNREVKRQTVEGKVEKFIVEVCNALGLLGGAVG